MSISDLMREITNADIRPDVFKVFLVATDHTAGFTAFVTFRSNFTNPNGISSVETRADTAEDALLNLKSELLHRFGRCEHCGNYHNRAT